MAAPRDYKSVIDGGGMIRWDWKNNKYVFINKDQLNKELNKVQYLLVFIFINVIIKKPDNYTVQ